MIPSGASVLDVGSGDGLLASLVKAQRPDLAWSAVDTLERPRTHIPVEIFDGKRLPRADKQVDVVLLIDVLHHVEDPIAMLHEAVRVARSEVVIKDHLRQGLAADPVLRFMDFAGNWSWGVHLPYRYWNAEQWRSAREQLRLHAKEERVELGLYPWWADWVFGRSLHFITRFGVPEDPRALR